jgi:hypothetical protein
VKTPLKILAVLGAAGFIWLVYDFIQFRRDTDLSCDTATVTGNIDSETFVKLRGCLARSVARKKTFVIINSPGGDNASALALGILIHRHKWDVEIVDYCASACANFIFPAGKTKYLNRNSMLLYHGGPYQETLWEVAKTYDQGSSMHGPLAKPVTLGRVNKENFITFDQTKPFTDREVHKFLSMTDVSTLAGLVGGLRKASDQFYQELGISPSLPGYGQLGDYEPKYKSDKYEGFIYRLDSLRRFGIRNIELKDGEWHPERNPAYPKVYEVTYP